MSRARGLSPLILISDVARIGEERYLRVLGAAVSCGLETVLLREPAWEDARIRELVSRVRGELSRLRASGVRILLGRRPELAAELDLEGVHVRGGDPREVGRARAIVGQSRHVGYSAHSVGELCAVAEEGADYVTFSPIFTPVSKRHSLPPRGLEGLSEACRVSPVPVYALGGVREGHAGVLRSAGAAGAAVIGAVLDAAEPGEAVARFLRGWERLRDPPPG